MGFHDSRAHCSWRRQTIVLLTILLVKQLTCANSKILQYFCDKNKPLCDNKKETINYVEKENSSKRYNNLQSKHKNLSFLPIMLWNWNCHYQYLMGEKNLKYLNQKFINVSYHPIAGLSYSKVSNLDS